MRAGVRTTVGQFSTDAKAMAQVARIVAADLQVRSVRLPAWLPLVDGGQELIYGRDERSWRFQLAPWPLDGEVA